MAATKNNIFEEKAFKVGIGLPPLNDVKIARKLAKA